LYTVSGNTPLHLDDWQTIWLIQTGAVALFAVRYREGAPAGSRHYLFDCNPDEALFPVIKDWDMTGVELVAVSLVETTLVAIPRTELEQQLTAGDDRAIALLHTWQDKLEKQKAKGKRQKAEDSEIVGWRDGEQDSPTPPLQHSLSDLDHIHTAFLKHLAQQLEAEQAQEQQRLQERQAFDQQVTLEAIADLGAVLQGRESVTDLPIIIENPEQLEILPLYRAMQAVGRAAGIAVQWPEKPEQFRRVKDPRIAIAHASRFRMRQVLLSDHWWQNDCGPLLAYTREENHPVALLPVSTRRYQLYDPGQDNRTPITTKTEVLLSPVAYKFYRPLPQHLRRISDLVQFSLRGTGRDWSVIAWAGTAATLLTMLVPQATAILIDQAIPSADRGLLAQVGLGLVAAVLGGAMFQLTQGFALVRLESLIESAAQTALWDRLLTLGIPFFRQFSVGDLRSRVSVVNTIRRQISGATLRTLLSSAFALLNLGLLVYYSGQLALMACAIALVLVSITALSGYFTLRQITPLQEIEGRIFGLVVQLINGVAKLRVAGAEERAFAYWSKQYSQQQRRKLTIQRWEDSLTVWNQVLPILGAAVLFGMAATLAQQAASSGFSTGRFLAFHVAFGSFLAGITTCSNTVVSLLSAFALSRRALPILAAQPEVEGGKSNPGELSGRVVVDRVSFRYRPDSPAILDQISIYAEPGEFVAIVGPSGSGKSTLFRLLLGFETPQSGQVFYDGQDLHGLNIQAVRRQLGVLLQTSRTMTASVFENIAGNTPITMSDAWEAAQQAGLADDISAMPMGMHTVVSEGGSNLSGGQRQRLLIARALALKPRILLFDEATSYLDNRTQEIVSNSLDKLKITRFVIAHRLSTIRNADRIYVMQCGRIVQQGRFTDLVEQEGLFRTLMQRQME
jgi:ATP-binding cassette subfamily C protein